MIQQLVREFHEAFDAPIGVDLDDRDTRVLRLNLINEEMDELSAALFPIGDHDLTEIADALGDLAYVVYGAAVTYGIDLDAVIEEIHRSNMTKLGANGKPIRRADGKVLKGPDFEPPNLDFVLGSSAT